MHPVPRFRSFVYTTVAFSIASLIALAAAGQADRPALTALAVDEGPTIDGDLSDAVWQRAERGGDFVQHEPQDLVPSTERTEFRVVYTPSTIYFAVEAFDSDPSRIVAKEMERDSQVSQDDSILILLDTFHDRRNAFAFETNANGARTDTLVTDEGADLNVEWDGIWTVAARRTAEGWVAEIAIPLSTLRFDPSLTNWGLNIQRHIARKREVAHWAGLSREFNVAAQIASDLQPVHRVSMAGELRGLGGLKPSQQLQVKPFVTVGATESPGTDESDEDGDVGLDVKWGITKSLALDLTYNTDFAEVEVDDQQVNLTRFSLFFPEKREFFLENAGIFDFGPPQRESFEPPILKAFFSRRMGLESGEEVPMEWGARVTGRVSGWNLGLLRVRTDRFEGSGVSVEATDFTVARAKRNLGERSTIGAIVTERDPSSDSLNRVFGLDFDYKPTARTAVGGFWSTSRDEEGLLESGTTGSREVDGGAYGFNLDYQSRTLTATLDVQEIDTDYRPEIGFLLRNDVTRINPRVQWLPRIEKGFVRSWFTEALMDYYETSSLDRLESRRVEVAPIGMRTKGEHRWRLSYVGEAERLDEPFEIFPGVVIPPGSYSWDGAEFAIFSNQSRVVGVRGRVSHGDFYEGERTSSSMTVPVRGSKRFQSQTSWIYNDIDLPQGAFEINLVQQRFDITFTPDLRINAIAQYNDAAETLGVNIRFNWIYRPGADLYVVYNENWTAPTLSSLDTTQRQLIVKFTYLFMR